MSIFANATGSQLTKRFGPLRFAFALSAEDRFHFDMSIGLPLVGLVVRYHGWLTLP